MAGLYSVDTSGQARRGWPEVRVLLSPTKAGTHWSVAEITWRGASRYSKTLARGRVAAGPDLSVRESYEAAWYEAMMACPEL